MLSSSLLLFVVCVECWVWQGVERWMGEKILCSCGLLSTGWVNEWVNVFCVVNKFLVIFETWNVYRTLKATFSIRTRRSILLLISKWKCGKVYCFLVFCFIFWGLIVSLTSIILVDSFKVAEMRNKIYQWKTYSECWEKFVLRQKAEQSCLLYTNTIPSRCGQFSSTSKFLLWTMQLEKIRKKVQVARGEIFIFLSFFFILF